MSMAARTTNNFNAGEMGAGKVAGSSGNAKGGAGLEGAKPEEAAKVLLSSRCSQSTTCKRWMCPAQRTSTCCP